MLVVHTCLLILQGSHTLQKKALVVCVIILFKCVHTINKVVDGTLAACHLLYKFMMYKTADLLSSHHLHQSFVAEYKHIHSLMNKVHSTHFKTWNQSCEKKTWTRTIVLKAASILESCEKPIRSVHSLSFVSYV